MNLAPSRPVCAHEEATPILSTSLNERLREQIDQELERWIPAGTRQVALVGFPNHSNVGDSAIWLGELAYCQQRGLRIVYQCDRRTYSRAQLSRRLGADGVILISGGGNFGDLFKGDQRLRDAVIEDFPGTPIVQMPQTIHFTSSAGLERAARVIERHRHLTLLLRDAVSLSFARRHFASASSALCPDMAFCLGSLARPAAPSRRVLWLWRADAEAPIGAAAAYHAVPKDTLVVDWGEGTSIHKRCNQLMVRTILKYPGRIEWLKRAVPLTFEHLANTNVVNGCRLLADGAVVVTNRLHGHILCLLMQIPHVVLDNSYGKIRRFANTWNTLSADVRFCESIESARVEAERLLSR